MERQHVCEARLEMSGKKSPPRYHPLNKKGEGETQPNKNCAKKQRIGNLHSHLHTRLKTDVTSAAYPLAIEVVQDRDRQAKSAGRLIKIEG